MWIKTLKMKNVFSLNSHGVFGRAGAAAPPKLLRSAQWFMGRTVTGTRRPPQKNLGKTGAKCDSQYPFI
jgi:hypothetical protein